ncbi:MAG TPA: HlyD family efflux transporter periplasmic adaptor subunit, partial [Blastocatellia bacterium]|nr:HlyD family efflux transporter periplasmic adaptor subunit [Blastocatellia bacterium]
YRFSEEAMDVPRKSAKNKKRIRKILYSLAAILAVGGITLAVSRLKPADPSAPDGTLFKDTVKRGNMLRQVRGLGTLVPEEIRYIPAISQGRVEKRLAQQGDHVSAGSILLELSNPEIEQAFLDAESRYRGAGANLNTLKAQMGKQLLDQKSTLQQVTSDFKKAKMQAEVFRELGSKGLKSSLEVNLQEIAASDLENRQKIEEQRLLANQEEIKARLAAEDEQVRQLKDAVQLRRTQLEALKVRAGIDGVLQTVEVQVGQQVTLGQNLARVANPLRLKAELRIAETQAKDIQLGQEVEIDTRNGKIPGKVIRIDPSVQNGTRTVDASLDGELPKGAVADLSVDGTILLERLENVLWVSRPVHGQENSTVGLFKVEPDRTAASRVQVKLGRSSVNQIEVLDGLKEGDLVILSDTSQWDNSDRIRLN